MRTGLVSILKIESHLMQIALRFCLIISLVVVVVVFCNKKQRSKVFTFNLSKKLYIELIFA